jgi:ribonuclease E
MAKPSFIESLESRLLLTAAPADPAQVRPPHLPDARLNAAEPAAPLVTRAMSSDSSVRAAVVFFPMRRAWFVPPAPAAPPAPAPAANTEGVTASVAAALVTASPVAPPATATQVAVQPTSTAREVADESAAAPAAAASDSRPVTNTPAAPAGDAAAADAAAYIFSRRRVVLVSAPYEGPATSAERLSLELIRSPQLPQPSNHAITHSGTIDAPPQVALAMAPIEGPNLDSARAEGTVADIGDATPSLASLDPATALLSLNSLRSQAAALAATLTVAAASLYYHLRTRRVESAAADEEIKPVVLPCRPRGR